VNADDEDVVVVVVVVVDNNSDFNFLCFFCCVRPYSSSWNIKSDIVGTIGDFCGDTGTAILPLGDGDGEKDDDDDEVVVVVVVVP